MKVTAQNVAQATPDRGTVETRIEIDGAGAHWITFQIIRTAAGWQILDGLGRDIGGTSETPHDAAKWIKNTLEKSV